MTLALLGQNARDWIQAATWVVGVAAGLFGILKIVVELRRSREQREQELQWRKAQAAKALNDEMLSDAASLSAMTMLDWDGREFEVKAGLKVTITEGEMLASLRTENPRFSDAEMFVRDSFDNLLYYLGVFEHYISRGLVDFMDVEYPIEYYVGLMAVNRPVFENYVRRYGFTRAAAFLGRFAPWRASGVTDGGGPSGRPMQPSGTGDSRITEGASAQRRPREGAVDGGRRQAGGHVAERARRP